MNTKEPIVVSEEILEDANYTRKTVSIRNGRILSYSECGNLDSKLVVLFHIGIMGSSMACVFVHQHALNFNLRVIMVDYPGTGESTPMPGRTLQDWGEDMELFCSLVLPENQNIRLLGHCLGVPHALAAWARMPERVSHVTLVAPWIGETKCNPWWMRYFVQQLPFQGYIPSVGAPLLNSGTYFNYPLSYLMPSEIKKLLRAVNAVQYYNRYQGLAGNKEMIRLALSTTSKEDFWDSTMQQIAASCESNAAPVRVLHGTSDAMVTLGASELLVKWLKEAKCQVEFCVVDQADHNTILIDPENTKSILAPLAE